MRRRKQLGERNTRNAELGLSRRARRRKPRGMILRGLRDLHIGAGRVTGESAGQVLPKIGAPVPDGPRTASTRSGLSPRRHRQGMSRPARAHLRFLTMALFWCRRISIGMAEMGRAHV